MVSIGHHWLVFSLPFPRPLPEEVDTIGGQRKLTSTSSNPVSKLQNCRVDLASASLCVLVVDLASVFSMCVSVCVWGERGGSVDVGVPFDEQIQENESHFSVGKTDNSQLLITWVPCMDGRPCTLLLYWVLQRPSNCPLHIPDRVHLPMFITKKLLHYQTFTVSSYKLQDA